MLLFCNNFPNNSQIHLKKSFFFFHIFTPFKLSVIMRDLSHRVEHVIEISPTARIIDLPD
jgi:hypothetical protein